MAQHGVRLVADRRPVVWLVLAALAAVTAAVGGSAVTARAEPEAQVQSPVGFGHPHADFQITQAYGAYWDGWGYHAGVDSWGENGSATIVAMAPGTVTEFGFHGSETTGWGRYAILRHERTDGATVYSVYAHMASHAAGLKVGECVDRGTSLGVMGKTGNTTGKHLHFEIKHSPGLGNGYYPTHPDNHGYSDPMAYIGSREAKPCETDQPPVEETPDRPPVDEAPARSTATRTQAMVSGHVAYLGLDPAGTLFTRFWSPESGWSPFTIHGDEGGWSREAVPAITEMDDGRLVLAAVDADGMGQTRVWNADDGWGELVQFGQEPWSTRGGVALAGRDDGQVTLMAVKAGGRLYRSNSTTGVFDDFATFGQGAWSPLAAPELITDEDGDLHVVMVKDNGTMHTNRGVIGDGWQGFVRQGGTGDWPSTAGAALLGRPDGIVTLAAVNREGALRTANLDLDENVWTGLRTRGEVPTWSRSVPPLLAVDADGRIWLGALKEAGNLFTVIGTPGEGYGDFSRHGDREEWTARGVPSMAASTDGHLVLGAVAAGGPLRSRIIDPNGDRGPFEAHEPADGPFDPDGALPDDDPDGPDEPDEPEPDDDPDDPVEPDEPDEPDDGDGRVVRRVAGTDRFATAARLSADRFAPGVNTVFVATGVDFADALTGGVAAALAEAPVLLAGPDTLPAVTADELDRLDPDRIVILGGQAAVSAGVETELGGHADEVDRLAGAERFATAAAIAQAAVDQADTVFVATGIHFPDGLAGVPAAVHAGAPLLLTTDAAVPEATAGELNRLDPDRIVILGGQSAVGVGVEAELAAYGEVERLAGAERFATAAAVADELTDPDAVYVATGGDFADALTAGAVAAAEGAPVLLTATDHLPEATAAALDDIHPGQVTLMGGTAAISDDVETDLATRLGE